MEIKKLNKHSVLYTNEKLIEMMKLTMFNATMGRIKSASEGVYGKEQGRLYVAIEDTFVGLIGVRRTDNFKVDIIHFAVDVEHQNQGIGKALLKAVDEMERVKEIHVEASKETAPYFRKNGFRVRESEDPLTGFMSYHGVLTCR